MGVNIHLLSVNTDEPVRFDNQPDWWDSNRYTGDSELVDDESIDWEYLYHDDETLKRPKDFQSVKQWVNEHVQPGNQLRLIKALDAMERDRSLWFLVSS